MTRYTIRAALLGFAALLAGCGPEKLLPTEVLQPETGPVQQITPTRSDPEAKKIVDSGVSAFTDGKPELLEKAKLCRYSLKGLRIIGNGQADATQSGTLAWPDRIYAITETDTPNGKLVTEGWLRRPELLIRNNGLDQRPANPADAELTVASDMLAQQWLALLVPLTDPKAVVFDPQTVTLEKHDLKLVKFALNEYPVYQLYFDAKSGALRRVEYAVNQTGALRETSVVFGEHKRGPNGFLLPTTLENLHNKALVEKWTVEKWEFPDAIKDDEFTPKKK